ncbi:MAG: hypothetical protein NVS2B16_28760 [Chloroflexota bacterium]
MKEHHPHDDARLTGGDDIATKPASGSQDTVSDAAYSDSIAGAAFEQSTIGSPTSESVSSAPYAEELADDPYGEQTRSFVTAPSGNDNDDSSPDADDPDVQENRLRIEHTRAELSETIDAIQQKLAPSHLAEQAKETVREATIGKAQDMMSNVSDTAMDAVSNVGDTAKGAGSSFVDTIRQNPIPAALAGVGLTWLFAGMRKNSANQGAYRRASDLPYTYSEDYTLGRSSGMQQQYYGGTDNRLDQVQNRAGDLANQAQNKAGDLASQAQDKAGNLANQAQDTAGKIGNQASDLASGTVTQAQYTAQRATTIMRENPLGAGAAALALGLVAGLAIPETAKEDQLMGPTRESLTQKAQQTVQQTAQKVQNVAQEAVSAGKQEAQDQNLV